MAINEHLLLIKIEDFVFTTCSQNTKPQLFYFNLSNLILSFNQIYNPSYEYFGCIQSFVQLIQDLNLHNGLINQNNLISQLKQTPFEEWKNYFQSYIPNHKRKLRDHRYNEKLNSEHLKRRMLELTQCYSRILVVRLDLAYKQDNHYGIHIEHFDQDMQKFRNKIHRREGIFADVIEYAWALEQGINKGYHCHLMLSYKGYEHQKAYGIAKQVGELWNRITHGQGCYFNCHDKDYLFPFELSQRVGIGMIHRNNPQQIDNMLYALDYLTSPEKDEQHLRVKTSPHMRTFGC